MENVEKTFKVLIDKHNFKYGYNNFSSFNDFLGPFYAYSFYNEYGCFTILHAVQRNEIEYYVSKTFSNKQEILLEEKISEQVFIILKHLRRNPLNWFKSDNVLLIGYIVDEIIKNGEFFGIKVKNNGTIWWENEIRTKFSFLEKYGFEFEFLALKQDDIVTFNTFVALIYKVNIYFVIKISINYFSEPICFYRLNGKNEINDIFLDKTDKEIEVYDRDLDLWKRVYKKNKFLRQSDVFTVVSESIKRQIETNKSFYGIPIDN